MVDEMSGFFLVYVDECDDGVGMTDFAESEWREEKLGDGVVGERSWCGGDRSISHGDCISRPIPLIEKHFWRMRWKRFCIVGRCCSEQ